MRRAWQLREIFGLSAHPDSPSYVDRGNLDDRLRDIFNVSRHVVIHGDSKQGKTWLRQRSLPENKTVRVQCTDGAGLEDLFMEALGQLGVRAEIRKTSEKTVSGELDFTASGELGLSVLARGGVQARASGSAGVGSTVEEQPIGRTPANLSWIALILDVSGRRLVLEDFHYLSPETQREFSYMMKAMGEYGAHIVVVGVWAQDHLLTYYNGDLAGRVEDIHLEWTDDELAAVLSGGADGLNVSHTDGLKAALVRDAYGNVGVIQRLVEAVLIHEGITETLADHRGIDVGPSLERSRVEIAASMGGRFVNCPAPPGSDKRALPISNDDYS